MKDDLEEPHLNPMSIRSSGEYCGDPQCPCHTDPAQRVRTPFPEGLGPIYCCNRCARLGSADGALIGPAELCARCGEVYGVGQSPYCKDGHAHVGRYHPFTPYFDWGLGCEVTSHAHRWRLMKEHHLDYRDHPSKGTQSARRDRIEERKKEEARA